MKQTVIIFLVLLAATLCACDGWEFFSFDKKEELRGTKPEVLIGKWEQWSEGAFFFDRVAYFEWYEFTHTGGVVTRQYYDYDAKAFREPKTLGSFANWAYSEEDKKIYFEKATGSRWDQDVILITPDSIVLGIGTYHKVTNN